MAVERREKDVSGGGGGKERNLSLVDVYDIAVDIGKVSGEQKGPQTISFSSKSQFFKQSLDVWYG